MTLSNLERQRRQIERERSAGIARVTVRIPEAKREALAEFVRQLNEAAAVEREAAE